MMMVICLAIENRFIPEVSIQLLFHPQMPYSLLSGIFVAICFVSYLGIKFVQKLCSVALVGVKKPPS